MKRYLLFIVALTTFTACKSRKVLIAKIDSIAIGSIDKSLHILESHIDTGSIRTQKDITVLDSSGRKVVIIPVSGKQIKVDKDGSFTGEALKVEIINKKQISTKQAEFRTEHRAINDQKIEASSYTKRKEISVSKKNKSIDSKPSYSWIWWVGGLLMIVTFLYRLYKKVWPLY